MRLFRTFLLIALTFVLIYTGSAYSSSPMDLIHQFTMENGLKVVLEVNRNAPVVALQIWVKIGSGDESEEEAGMCHFIEHMLFKGTEKRKAGEMAKEIESLSGIWGQA